MNQPSQASSPQHSAIGGPLPVLLDFHNGGRGWRMSLGALVQASLLGLVLVLPLLYRDGLSPQPLADTMLPPYQRGNAVTVIKVTGGGNPNPGPRINTSGLTSPFIKTPPEPTSSGPVGFPTEGGENGPGGDRPGVPWGVENGIPPQGPVTPVVVREPPMPKAPVRVGGVVRPPRLIHRVEPTYPLIPRRAGIQGEVVMEAVLGEDGRVREITIKSGHPSLAPAAREAVAQWVYEPTLLNGEPYPVVLEVKVRFYLNR